MASSVTQLYEERVLKSSEIPLDELPQELDQTLKNRIVSFQWSKGTSPGSVTAAPNVDRLQTVPACDLQILLAPLDLPERPRSYPGFKRLVSLYTIPDKFLSERLHDVTFSFGSQIEGGYKTIWMHLLFKDIPSAEKRSQQEEEGWVRASFFLRSRESDVHHTPGTEQGHCSTAALGGPKVVMLCFGAVKHFRQRCTQMRFLTDWERILDHPAILVGYFLESWYDRVDTVVWNAHERGRTLETQTLSETSKASLERPTSDLRLEDLYRLLQTVLWLREGLEATLRASELFIDYYSESIGGAPESISEINLLADFKYARESFRATQFRLVSLQQRLESINSIMYSVASLRENRLMYRSSEDMRNISKSMSKDSATMATIAILGAIFLPTTMIATILSAVLGGQASVGSVAKIVGILFAVAVPMTIALIILLYSKLAAHLIQMHS